MNTSSSLASVCWQKRQSFAMSPGWWVVVLATVFSRMCVDANEVLPDGAFSVALKRQKIPLHSDGGVVHYKSAYYGEISVGEPLQNFEVVFDTGSGHLVLPSTLCRSETCRNHRRYQRRASKHSIDIDVDGTKVFPGQPRDQITVSFGTGEIQGIFVHDKVCMKEPQPVIDGEESNSASFFQKDMGQLRNVTLPQEDTESEDGPRRYSQSGCIDLRLIAAIDMTEDPFGSFAFDGVLGLGLPGLSQSPEFNFLDTAASLGAWHVSPGMEKMFAVFLATSEDEQGEITFGGFRREHMGEAELAWCDVVEPGDGYWQLEVKSIKAGDTVLDFCAGGDCRAVVDTGTSLLGVPSSLGPQLVRLLRHESNDASCIGPGPRLEIDLGNFTVILEPGEYARPEIIEEEEPAQSEAELAKNKTLMKEEKEDKQPLRCVPMLMHIDLPLPLGPRTLILGEPVLQKYYTAFDVGEPRIGFAQALHSEGKPLSEETIL